MLLPTIPLFLRDICTVSKKQIGVLVLLASFDSLATLANTKAFEVNISISAAILAVPSGMILAYILSVLKPKLLEKHTRRVYIIRFAAAAVIVLVGLRLSG